MADTIKIAMIGLDTSHAGTFARILMDSGNPWHVPGARIVSASPAFSSDMPRSVNRVDQYTKVLREVCGVPIYETIEEACKGVDAIMVESVDGRVHLEQFQAVATKGRPVFIDKPLAVTGADARNIADLSTTLETPLMSCSALRFAEALQDARETSELGPINGADFYGPMGIEPTQPGFFWYGIHIAEMLFSVLGVGPRDLRCLSSPDHDLLAARWPSGRLGTIRGYRSGNNVFGGTLHRESGSQPVRIDPKAKPFYASLLEAVVAFFKSGISPVDINETVALIEFLEEANRMRGDPDLPAHSIESHQG